MSEYKTITESEAFAALARGEKVESSNNGAPPWCAVRIEGDLLEYAENVGHMYVAQNRQYRVRVEEPEPDTVEYEVGTRSTDELWAGPYKIIIWPGVEGFLGFRYEGSDTLQSTTIMWKPENINMLYPFKINTYCTPVRPIAVVARRAKG